MKGEDDRVTPQSADESPGSILGRIHEAVDRTRDLARGGSDVASAAQAWTEAQAAALLLEDRLRGSRQEDLLDRLSLAMEEVEQAARDFFRDSSIRDDEAARRLSVLRAASRLLRRLARALEGRPPRDETPFLLQELRELDRAIAAKGQTPTADDELNHEPIETEIDRLRFEILQRQAEALLDVAQADDVCNEESANRIFRLSRALRRITNDLQDCAQDGGESLRDRLMEFAARAAQERTRLQELFSGWLRQITTQSELQRAAEAALLLTGELDEARSGAAEHADARAVVTLQSLRADGVLLHRQFRDARKSVKAAEKNAAEKNAAASDAEEQLFSVDRVEVRLRKMSARLRDALADRVLNLRLEKIFGPRMTRIWEAVIFWMIMAVIGLIFVDHASDPTPEGEIGWSIWVDTVICVFLLTDFFVRLTLSPERLRYFRRRFLTEFLPSLPFGLLSSLEALGSPTLRNLQFLKPLRSLRTVRPLLRIFRLFLFLARAADRLVERNAWFLNQNIIFFSDPIRDREDPTLLSRARDLDTWIARRSERRLADLDFDSRREGCRWQLQLLEVELPARTRAPLAAEVGRMAHQVRDLHVDDVIAQLRALDDNQVAEFVGADVARQVTASLSFFRLPLLRRLPVVRFLLGSTGAPDPLWTTARLGRVAGDFLAWIQRLLNWFADLYGTITGAQFLDRLGMQLIKATARPAKRLVIFSVVVILILAFVHLIRFAPLIRVFDGVYAFIDSTLLLLGIACFLPLALGYWLRHIGGQAVDLFDRVAEAQFLALTETVKEDRSALDLEFLADRVLLPEVAHDDHESPAMTADRDFILRAVRREKLAQPQDLPVSWSALETMMLFYRDFIDGAYFHRNDTKVANMLLGNLTLENIRRVRLRYDAKRFKQLDRLDIGRGKGGVTGPRVWFDFITHSVSQHVARLIIEYNQHCIPVDELDAADQEDRLLYDAWLQRRRRLTVARAEDQTVSSEDLQLASGAEGTLLYRTTEFNALHFLTADPKRDHDVSERYGEAVATLLVEDRESLVRDIFGTFPMHELPKEKRTVNPYLYYRRYLARGRVFFFPFIALFLCGRGLRLLVARIVAIIKDVLDPTERPIDVNAGRAGFDVARRKIFRMRRPVVMETLRLRALFDIEYLGIAAPLGRSPSPNAELLVDDLRYLEASEREWELFREIKSERERQIRLLARHLQQMKARGHDFVADVIKKSPALANRQDAALRAAATAFVCDHEEVSTAITVLDAMIDLVATIAVDRPQDARLFERVTRRRLVPVAERVWPVLRATTEKAGLTSAYALANAIATRYPKLEASLTKLAELLDQHEDLSLYVYEELLNVARQPSSWSEQMVSLRAVQSLGILDLQGYEDLIVSLGRYQRQELGKTSGRKRVGL